MKIPGFLLLAALSFFAVGCGDSVEKTKSQARRAATTAIDALATYKAGDPTNFEGVRLQIRALKASLASKDFAAAGKAADEVDKFLNTKVVARSVEFLRVESVEGAQKATAAVSEYMETNELDVMENEVCRELLRYFRQMDKRQAADLVAIVVYISLENKMSHGAAIPSDLARVLVEELLGIENVHPRPRPQSGAETIDLSVVSPPASDAD